MGVLGEVLITAGAVVLLFVGWQLWIGDIIIGAQNNQAGQELIDEWTDRSENGAATKPDAEPATAKPPKMEQPADTEVFGVMQIPRFGKDYSVNVAGGVTRAGTLDHIGIGHYPGAEMPGQVGNFSLAAHRTTWGAPFNQVAELRLGDAIVVTTEEGWYTYRFRTLEYVVPTQTDVLLDVPQEPDVPKGERFITLTSCSPMGSLAERIVAYGVFDSFTPRTDAGPPKALTEGVGA